MKKFQVESIGELKRHPDIPDEWLISKPISIPFFEGKELKFTFINDLENDSNFLFDANQAITDFLKMEFADKTKFTKPVYEDYKKTQSFYDSQSWNIKPLELEDNKDIWRYIYPQEIFVCRGDNQDENVYIVVACGCEWEDEHGLQLVFKNGKELTRVSAIDYSPTE